MCFLYTVLCCAEVLRGGAQDHQAPLGRGRRAAPKGGEAQVKYELTVCALECLGLPLRHTKVCVCSERLPAALAFRICAGLPCTHARAITLIHIALIWGANKGSRGARAPLTGSLARGGLKVS